MNEPIYSEGLSQVLARLDTLTNWEQRPRTGMRVDLQPIADLMDRLGNPHRHFRSVHVAGTKGKSSTCALIEAALVKGGVHVGRYISPHVNHICERVSIDGAPVSEPDLAAAIGSALDGFAAALEAGTPAKDATWFDILTAAAFLLFRRYDVTWAVVETGLGGRLDSTNIVASDVQIITNIDLEHTEVLGKTRSQIAYEKAGIIKPGAHVITPLGAKDEAGQVIQARAKQLGARLLLSSPGATMLERNKCAARLALDAIQHFDSGIGSWLLDDKIAAITKLPGRLEIRSVAVRGTVIPLVLDGAHVPFNLAAVLADIEPDISNRPCTALVAIAADKDAKGLLEVLNRWNVQAIFTSAGGRFSSPDELDALAKQMGLPSGIVEDPAEAYRLALQRTSAQGGWMLVTGSLYLVSLVHENSNPQAN